MTELKFCAYTAYDGPVSGKLAQMETVGEYEIPVNIFAVDGSDFGLKEGTLCVLDLQGYGYDLSIYPTREAFEAAKLNLAPQAMIPIGTFPPGGSDPDFRESPHILFTGIVTETDRNPDAGPDDPNLYLSVETLCLTIGILTRFDGPVEAGNIVYGTAWLFSDIRKEPISNQLPAEEQKFQKFT